MKNYINQYKMLFCFSWLSMHVIFPTWALPVAVSERFYFFAGLAAFFAASAYVMNRLYNSLPVYGPLLINPKDFFQHVKNYSGLFLLCTIAILLHISHLRTPIYLVGDEALFLQDGLWIYDYFGAFWFRTVQYIVWTVLVGFLIMFIKNYTAGNNSAGSSIYHTEMSIKPLFIFAIAFVFVIYFALLHNMPPNVVNIRYHPLYKFLYLFSYCIAGINYIGPRIVQLMFYIFSAVFIYRTLNMFHERNISLLGASIYLFSPVIFSYAHFAEIASGLIFFVILISYYFLRYLTYENHRDLLLSSCFTGIGFLYKEDAFLMFFVLLTYIFLYKIKKKDLFHKTQIMVFILSLTHIIPFLIMRKFYNWRGAWISLSQFTSFDAIMAYLALIPAQISWFIFLLFIVSFIFVLIAKRNHLSLYYGFLFVAYYAFYTSQHLVVAVDRFAMAFYPTIAVFISIFVSILLQKITWRHTFKVAFSVLSIYLIVLCTVPSVSEHIITFKNKKEQYFPNEKAMIWVRDNVKNGEKILSLHFKPDLFYRDKFEIGHGKIVSFWYELQEYFPNPQRLKAFCNSENISYILFPDGPSFLLGTSDKAVFTYLKADRTNFTEIEKFNLGDNYIYIYKLIN